MMSCLRKSRANDSHAVSPGRPGTKEDFGVGLLLLVVVLDIPEACPKLNAQHDYIRRQVRILMQEKDNVLNEIPKKRDTIGPKFLSNPFFKVIDGALIGALDLVKSAGLQRQFMYSNYLNADWFWHGLMKNLFDFEIHGAQHVPLEGTGGVVCVNHTSFLDQFIMGVSVAHETRRVIHIMGKQEIFNTPLMNAYFRWIYGFPVKRGEHDMESYNYAIDLLKKGELVGMFPEATLNEGGTKFLKAKTGAVRMAIEAEVPIIPLSTTGADKIIGKDMKAVSLSRKLVARFGEPFTMH
nr:lysophospholipid acyltransferase family protein [Candidatus Sigynarchaeota archaeon]